jgi:N-terminal domain of toast_rack, DUF2154
MSLSRVMTGALLVLALAAALVLAGCGIGVGPTQETVIDEPLGSAAVTDVVLSMGAGTLKVQPGAEGLASGVVRCNVEAWVPEVVRTDSSLSIKQGSTRGLSGLGDKIVNDWDLKLGKAPMRLNVSAGAYDGSYELGGLSLQRLSVKDGASKSQVSFSSPNPSQMELLKYETGASTVSLSGLAYANFRKLEFNGGAGSFTLDFSGQLRSDGSARIKAGVGQVHLIIPANMAVKVVVSGKLADVQQEGSWVTTGRTYSTPAVGVKNQGKLITITVDMSVGSLLLTNQGA